MKCHFFIIVFEENISCGYAAYHSPKGNITHVIRAYHCTRHYVEYTKGTLFFIYQCFRYRKELSDIQNS